MKGFIVCLSILSMEPLLYKKASDVLSITTLGNTDTYYTEYHTYIYIYRYIDRHSPMNIFVQ